MTWVDASAGEFPQQLPEFASQGSRVERSGSLLFIFDLLVQHEPDHFGVAVGYRRTGGESREAYRSHTSGGARSDIRKRNACQPAGSRTSLYPASQWACERSGAFCCANSLSDPASREKTHFTESKIALSLTPSEAYSYREALAKVTERPRKRCGKCLMPSHV